MSIADTVPLEDCILQQLKLGTQTHHHSIENAIPVMREDLTEKEYVDILKHFYGFYQTFESSLAKFPHLLALIPDLETRHKLALLKRDLEFYGFEDSDLEVLPCLPESPMGNTECEALGSLYVMEGATLGGQLISKHLRDHLGLTSFTGAAFYNAYDENTGKMWQSLKKYLKTHVRTKEQKDQAVNGAQNTFTVLQNWMTKSFAEILRDL